MKVQHSA